MLMVFIHMHILKVEGVGLQLAPFFCILHTMTSTRHMEAPLATGEPTGSR